MPTLNLTDVELVLLATLAAVVLALVLALAVTGAPLEVCCDPAPVPGPASLDQWAEHPA